MKKYIVRAPIVVFSIRDGEKGTKEHTHTKGETVELPEENATVRSLVASRKITEVEAPAEAAATTKGSKK